MKKVGTRVRSDRRKKRNGKKRSVSTIKKRDAIVRVIGHGQFKVNDRTAMKIKKIDNELINIIEIRKQGEKKYSAKVEEALGLVKKNGLPLQHTEIIQSDIIVPGADISIDELAKRLFTEQHIIE